MRRALAWAGAYVLFGLVILLVMIAGGFLLAGVNEVYRGAATFIMRLLGA